MSTPEISLIIPHCTRKRSAGNPPNKMLCKPRWMFTTNSLGNHFTVRFCFLFQIGLITLCLIAGLLMFVALLDLFLAFLSHFQISAINTMLFSQSLGQRKIKETIHIRHKRPSMNRASSDVDDWASSIRWKEMVRYCTGESAQRSQLANLKIFCNNVIYVN